MHPSISATVIAAEHRGVHSFKTSITDDRNAGAAPDGALVVTEETLICTIFGHIKLSSSISCSNTTLRQEAVASSTSTSSIQLQ